MNYLNAIYSCFVHTQRKPTNGTTTQHILLSFISLLIITSTLLNTMDTTGGEKYTAGEADRPKNQNMNYRNKKLNVGHSST